MSEVVQMSVEQLQQIIEAVLRRNNVAATESGSAATKPKGSISNCSVRFNGVRDHERVEEFLTSVITYKDVEGVSDEDALRGISLLFTDLASTWWQGVRKEAKTWPEAIALIREHFSPQKPAYQVYLEIFDYKQDARTAIHTFVCKQRALLAQLPDGRHDEATELDFIYGLLHIKYRKHIARHEVSSFKDLLEKGAIIEHNNLEAEAQERNVESERSSGKGAKRCSYCSYRGHTSEQCRKRKGAVEQPPHD